MTPASGRPNGDAPDIEQALDLAMQHHAAGRLPQAEQIYQQILQTDHSQPVALHLLGLIAHQVGDNEVAVDLITRALAVNPDFAEAYSNLGIALQDLGRLDDAVANYHKALAIKPNFAGAYNNLGNALYGLEKPDEAVTNYRKAIAIEPDFAGAHNNLGIALYDLGRLEDAVASIHKAIAIAPDFAGAHNNLGTVLQDLGRLKDAVASIQKAIANEPDFAAAHNNLGNVLQDLGQQEDAFTCQRRAVALDPQNDVFWTGLAASLEGLSFASVDDGLFQDLLRLIEQPTVRLSLVIRPIVSALRQHPKFSQALELTASGKPAIEIAYGDIAEQLSGIPLFRRIMALSLIHDLGIERMLTFLRRAMLQEAMAGRTDESGLKFSTALALQCFTNEYIFPETDEETASVDHLHQQIATLVEKKRDVPSSFIATLGAYRPLHGFPWARELCDREWAGSIKDVIERQISEPLEELSLRSRIPPLTSINHPVSQSVREQYEENPYPRWIKTDIEKIGGTIRAVLQGSPLLGLDLGDYQSPESPEILVAGCGTGQHALNTASGFSNARVLAVDLSLSSLSYALRKTEELGFSNIEYAQGDIIELGSLGRRFDLIECAGVLHHLGDPLAGWRVLVDLLRPGGLMKIGLYSETARRGLASGRTLIAEKGYTPSPEDIRRCRQDIIAMAEDGNGEMAEICKRWDFFGLSNCRDLLFHVQEHRFTLPQIEAALTSLELKFLGFEMRDQRALRNFKESHSSRGALTSLSLWHKFELMSPDTFRGMYQFWCQKI